MTSPDVLGSGGRAADPAPEKAPALPTGRNIELVLLAFAAAIVTAALVLVEANQENELTRALLYVGAAYLGLFTVAHFAVRKLAPYADPVMLPCVALLNGLGLVMIHRLDLAAADRAVALGREAPTVLIQRQVAWTAIGLVLFVGVLYFVRNHRTLARYGYTAGFAGLVLLALPGLLPSSISEVNGARIWLRLGHLLDPARRVREDPPDRVLRRVPRAEARAVQRGRPHVPRHGVPPRARPRAAADRLGALGRRPGARARPRHVPAVLRHRAGAALHRHRTRCRGWSSGCRSSWPAASWPTSSSATCARGCEIWLDPFADFNGSGYQLGQALFGLGTGGIGGTGLGAGRPDLVPYAESDFMFSSLGEELGLVGLAAILRRLPRADHPRAAHRARGARQLRQAPRHRPGLHAGPADVRRRSAASRSSSR